LPTAAIVIAVAALGTVAHFATAGRAALGVRVLALPDSYRTACADCHTAHHPSLLPAASWVALMRGLDDHFGEDASLDTAKRSEIEDFLAANAAETWDTEAANNFRAVSPSAPLRITRTDFWQRRHAGIATTTFKAKAVGGQANCAACHRDADSGRFDDQSISPPRETHP
jgi:cytochrome c peroxidase